MRLISRSYFDIIVNTMTIDSGYSNIHYIDHYKLETFDIPFDKIVKELKLR